MEGTNALKVKSGSTKSSPFKPDELAQATQMSHVAAKQSESWGKKLGAMTPYDEKEFIKNVEATTISLYSVTS